MTLYSSEVTYDNWLTSDACHIHGQLLFRINIFSWTLGLSKRMPGIRCTLRAKLIFYTRTLSFIHMHTIYYLLWPHFQPCMIEVIKSYSHEMWCSYHNIPLTLSYFHTIQCLDSLRNSVSPELLSNTWPCLCNKLNVAQAEKLINCVSDQILEGMVCCRYIIPWWSHSIDIYGNQHKQNNTRCEVKWPLICELSGHYDAGDIHLYGLKVTLLVLC